MNSAERPPHTMVPHISFRHPSGVCPYLVRDPLAHIRKQCNSLARSLLVMAILPVVDQPTSIEEGSGWEG